MREGNTFALHDINAHGGRVEQHVNDVIVQKVDLVDVQETTIGLGKHAGLEVALALLDGLFDIKGPDDAVFGGADGQVDKGRGAGVRGRLRLLSAKRSLHSVHQVPGLSGSQPKRQSSTTRTCGKRAAKARAAVDLAVPRSPRIRTPPMRVSTAFRISARRMRSWPTMAVNG